MNNQTYTPNRYQKIAAVAVATLLLIPALNAVTIVQGTGDNYIKFEAGSYDTIEATGGVTDNGDGTLTTASPLVQTEITYTFDIKTTGPYYLYFERSAPDAGSDSLFVKSSFNEVPAHDSNTYYAWNNLATYGVNRWAILNDSAGTDVSYIGGNTTYTSPDYTFGVSETGTVTLTLVSRETGLNWLNFVMSTDPTLTATQLNSLSGSSTIPEPSVGALAAGMLALALVSRRRRQ